jgi:hypothetical protein
MDAAVSIALAEVLPKAKLLRCKIDKDVDFTPLLQLSPFFVNIISMSERAALPNEITPYFNMTRDSLSLSLL